MPEVEEDKPEPDLDELLELFREPEEEPRRRKKGSGAVLMMGALILSIVGGWMAALVANRPAAKHATPGPPVLPTKVSDRKPREGQAGSVDLVQDYIARCQKGITEREVRWILEDFQKAGLAQEGGSASTEELVRRRKAQHAWYLDLLADGLRLDPGQKRMAREKLAGLFEEAAAGFKEELGELKSDPLGQDEEQVSADLGTIPFIDPKHWLTDKRYAPWELCDLTEAQLRVTWQPVLAEMDKAGKARFPGWFNAPSSNLVTFEEGKDPVLAEGFGPRPPATHLELASSVFPVPAIPPFSGPAHLSLLLGELRSYHPSQLKTLLLLEPQLANEALSDFEKSGQ